MSEEAMARAPQAVRAYMERGFNIPEKYWADVEARIPWSELMDDWDPDRTVTYYPHGPVDALVGALDRFCDWLWSVPGRIAGRVSRR